MLANILKTITKEMGVLPCPEYITTPTLASIILIKVALNHIVYLFILVFSLFFIIFYFVII